MKLTKEDYMRLPKERLADLLVERDNEKVEPIVIPPINVPTPVYPCTPWWKDNMVYCHQDTVTSAKLNTGEE